MLTRVRRLWESITEPRHLKALYFVIYATAATVGLITLVVPPRTFDGGAGVVATGIVSWLLMFGGAGGMLTVFPGWWWAERVLGIAPILLGLAVMLVSLVILNAQHAQDDESRLTQIGVAVLAAAPFGIRFLLIREYSYEPRR